MDMVTDIYHMNGKAFEVTMEYVAVINGWPYQSDDYEIELEHWEPCKEVSVN